VRTIFSLSFIVRARRVRVDRIYGHSKHKSININLFKLDCIFFPKKVSLDLNFFQSRLAQPNINKTISNVIKIEKYLVHNIKL